MNTILDLQEGYHVQRMKTCCFLVTACVFVLTATSATAQTILIPSQPTCPDCTIQWTPLVTLGDADGPGAIGSLSTITQLADGRYVASFDEADEELVVFSADGRYIRRFGRRGEGPGEFQFIRWVRAHGSELHVFDGQLLRQTVLSAKFRVIRTNRFPVAPFGDVEVIDDSTAIMNGFVRTRERIGFLLHEIDNRGDIRTSFAEEADGVAYTVSEEVYFRHLSRSPSSSKAFWSAHRTKLQVDEWDLDGTLRRSVVRHAEWFPGHRAEDEGPPDPGRPRLPRQFHACEDNAGRLWSFSRVVDQNWADALEPVSHSAHPEQGRFKVGHPDSAYDTVVEVIDLHTGALVSSMRFDRSAFEFIGCEQAITRSEHPNGSPRLQVWRVSLKKPEPRRQP